MTSRKRTLENRQGLRDTLTYWHPEPVRRAVSDLLDDLDAADKEIAELRATIEKPKEEWWMTAAGKIK